MKAARTLLLGIALAGFAFASQAAELNCAAGASNTEDFRYEWHLRGATGWLAGFIFPSKGVGNLKTTFPKAGEHEISSQLMMTSTDKSGFYVYESQMDESASKTLMTYHGYAWGKKARKERTVFDYVKRLMRIHRETTEKVEDRVKLIPSDELRDASLRDILTAIYYLRQHATEITSGFTTTIFSDGKPYNVVFRPIARATFTMNKQTISGLGFEIADAPGGRKWQGGVRVWISNDERRIPFRIEISESIASMQLDLTSVEACGFMGREERKTGFSPSGRAEARPGF
jgi:hypothetical protein